MTLPVSHSNLVYSAMPMSLYAVASTIYRIELNVHAL